MSLAIEIWDQVQAHHPLYRWEVRQDARRKLELILKRELPWADMGEGVAEYRAIRSTVHQALHASDISDASRADLYEWIVCEWGGVRAGRATVREWSLAAWSRGYDDDALNTFAGEMGRRRISSWSKILAFAAPDRHAIYDSRVAVALNLALERLGRPERYFMPPSREYVGRDGKARPNAVARARRRLGWGSSLGYRDYLSWLNTVVSASGSGARPLDFIELESGLFAVAPLLAEEGEQLAGRREQGAGRR